MAPLLRMPIARSSSACLAYVPLAGFLLGTGTTFAAGTDKVAASQPVSATDKININVTGKIVDDNGSPIPGASVVLKGTTTGTSTDAEGMFRINLPTGNETLIISSVGFQKQEIAVGGRTTINIMLKEEASALDEVVVVGYGTQKKIHLTGAVATVDMKAVQDLPVGSLSTALQGQLPNVSVSGGTARPGEAGSITIRNPVLKSKDGGTLSPLYVIDNVVRTEDDFNVLDASEVESISVLKDAAAAIYGARSSQGVIVVTTKRGKAGAPRFSYNTSVGITDAVRLPSMMNGVQHATYMNDIYRTRKFDPLTNKSYYTDDELKYFANNNYDWLDNAWQSSMVMRHALNMSGGSERATYFAGVTYTGQDANFDNINANKWTFRASTDVNVAKGLRAGLSISGDLSQKRMYYLKQGGESAEKDMEALLKTPQFTQPYVNGLPVLLRTSGNLNSTEAFHFFEVQRSNNYTSDRSTGLNLTANAEYELPFVKGLKIRGVFGKTMDNTFGKQYGTRYNVYQFAGQGTNGHIPGGDIVKVVSLNNGDRVRINPSFYDSYQLNGYLTYDRQFGRHHISAIAFVEQSENHSDGVAAMTEGAILGGLDNMRYTTGTQTASESESENGLLSMAGRINYNFANKYLLEVAVRRDGSTAFAPQYRWGTFPSVSAGWVISEEGFFRNNVQFMSFLKLRASAGHMGGDATKAYQWQENYAIQTGKAAVFGGNTDRGYVITPNNSMANPYVQWDDVNKYNGGIDMQFLDNRLSFTADGYYNHHYNMLTALSNSVSLLVGANPPSENYSVINTFGYELSLGYNGRVGSDLGYRINSFFAWSDNKQVQVDVNKGLLGTYLDPTGQSSDQGVLGYRYTGMIRTEADLEAWKSATGWSPTNGLGTIMGLQPQLGMLTYQDVRGPKDANGNFTGPDGKITDADLQYLTKKASNHYSVGLNPSISYKGLTISATMGASFGGQSLVEGNARKQATDLSNRPSFWADHYTPENTNATYPDPWYKDSYEVTSDFWFRSSFTAGMRNANVSYTFPTPLVNRAGINSLRVYFVAINPLNFYNPYDYKVFGGSYDAYPTLRSLSLGLNIGL